MKREKNNDCLFYIVELDYLFSKINTYAGKVTVPYVWQTPKTSKGSVSKTEYYRNDFNPNFHPLIYQMLNTLSQQASLHQKLVNPVYDKFLKDIHTQCMSSIDNNNSTNKEEIIRHKDWFVSKRFASLSITTFCNRYVCGFSSVKHKDNDWIPTRFYPIVLKILKEYVLRIPENKSEYKRAPMSYIKNLYMRQHKFSSFTTCGYKVFCDDAQTKYSTDAFFYF